MLEILYLGSCDFKQKSGLKIVPHLNWRSAKGGEKMYLWNMCFFQGSRLIVTDLKWNC